MSADHFNTFLSANGLQAPPRDLTPTKFAAWVKGRSIRLPKSEIDRLYGDYQAATRQSTHDPISDFVAAGATNPAGEGPIHSYQQRMMGNAPPATPSGPTATTTATPAAPAKAAPSANPAATTAPSDTSSFVEQMIAAGHYTPDQAAQIRAAAANQGVSDVHLWASSLDETAPVRGIAQKGPAPGQHGTFTDASDVYATKAAGLWLQDLYKMSPSDLAALKSRMWSQGWYLGSGVKDPRQLGSNPDPATIDAYSWALSEAARYNAAGEGFSIDGVIDMHAPFDPQRAKAEKAAQPNAPNPYGKANPQDYVQPIQGAAQQRLGRNLSPQEAMAYASGQASQADAASAELARRQAANESGGVAGPASPTAAAGAYFDTHDLVEQAAYGAATRQQAFFSLLNAPVGYKAPLS